MSNFEPDEKVRHFVDDSHGFLQWRAENPRGYVIGWDDKPGEEPGTRMHVAACRALDHDHTTTSNPYSKSCSTDLNGLVAYWEAKHEHLGGRRGKRCDFCVKAGMPPLPPTPTID